jgi:hypothetical protein
MPKPIERQPANPLPVNYQPFGSIQYKVKDLETWEDIAGRHRLDVHELIYFNFQTNNPDEVNWYLRRNVGCNVESPSRLNWAFSSSANPGIIYLPISYKHVKPKETKKKQTNVSPIALYFEGPSSPFDKIGKIFDVYQLIDIGMAIFAGAAAEGALLFGGTVTAVLGPFVMMGQLAEAPIIELKKQQMSAGLPLGIVLGADGRSLQWVKTHNGYDRYVKTQKVQNTHYPEYGKELADLYNKSFFYGHAIGQQFSQQARGNLFRFLGGQLSRYARTEYRGDPKLWTDRKQADFYRLLASILARHINFDSGRSGGP